MSAELRGAACQQNRGNIPVLASLGPPLNHGVMQRKTLALVVSVAVAAAPVAASTVDRAQYQTAIAKQFPGFEILRADQFQTGWREAVRDGEYGSLIVGRFNFDAYTDFVAYLVPAGAPTSGQFNGLRVECFGSALSKYKCSSQKVPLYLPRESALTLVGSGEHQCMNDADTPEWVAVSSEIDSIGEYSEKGGGFIIRHRNGSEFTCFTSD